ncbi:hypothetical protein CR513_27201, partial [Mucuna pruriens]
MCGYLVAVRKRTTMSPAKWKTEWWKMYRAHTSHLQNLAMKVLSLTCSLSGCEHNWSTFKHINSFEEFGYGKYNQVLQERNECRDLIVLNDSDSNEWIVGELDGDGEDAKDELIFDDYVLTWRDVCC